MMSGETPIAASPAVVQATPQAVGGRVLHFSHTALVATQSKNIANDIKNLGHGMDMASILEEFEWQQKDNSDIRDSVITQTSPMFFVFTNVGSPFIQLVHLVGKFGVEPFGPAEYQGRVIGFVGDRTQGVNSAAILVEDDIWKWTKAKVMPDVVKLVRFYSDLNNQRLRYTLAQGDHKDNVETSMVLMIPVGLVEWLLTQTQN